jgi:hypothetical protein
MQDKAGIRTAEDAATLPDAAEGGREAIAAVGRHGGLDDLQGLTEGGDLEQVQTSAKQQVGELDGLLLQLLRRGRDRGDGGGHDWVGVTSKGALTKGRGCFFAGLRVMEMDGSFVSLQSGRGLKRRAVLLGGQPMGKEVQFRLRDGSRDRNRCTR